MRVLVLVAALLVAAFAPPPWIIIPRSHGAVVDAQADAGGNVIAVSARPARGFAGW